MHLNVYRAVLAAGFLCAVAGPARAVTITDVQTRVDTAMKSAKSFVVTTDVIIVGDTQYSSKNGTPFEKAAVSPDERTRFAQIGQVKVGALHADVSLQGVRDGTFDAPGVVGDAQTPAVVK